MATRVASREKRCAQCHNVFVVWAGAQGLASKFCSRRCTGEAARERARKSRPSEEETRAAYYTELLSDAEFGRRYGHSYQWALGVRRHYGITAVPTEERRTRKREAMRASPQAQARERLVRSAWNMAEKSLSEGREELACRNCGRTDLRLHLHHAVPRSMCKAARLDLRNGVPLCTNCHLGWHHRRVTIPRSIFTPIEWAFISSLDLTGQNITAWLDERYPDLKVGLYA